MDGKRPETAGTSKPVDSRSSKRGNEHPFTSLREIKGSDIALGKNGIRFCAEMPTLDWDLLSSFCLPGENASLSLHDGDGVFLKVAGAYEKVWDRSEKEICNSCILDLIEPSKEFNDWFLNLESGFQSSTLPVSINSGSENSAAVVLKRIPIFVGTHSSQTRIVLKALRREQKKPDQSERCKSLSSKYTDEGSFIHSNSQWNESLDYASRDLETLTFLDLAPEDERVELSNFLNAIRESDRVESRSIRLLTSKGFQKTLLVSGQFSNGQFEFEAQDLTLDSVNPLSSLQRISACLGTTSIAMVEASVPGCQLSQVNYAFEKATGYRDSDNLTVLDLFGQDSDTESTSKIVNAIREAKEGFFEKLIRRKNGASFWGSIRIYPLRDNHGRLHFSALAIEDITRERESQKTAIQQDNLRSLGQMASGIAHDFNNLLAPILGFSELLLNMPAGGRDDTKLVSFLEKIKVAAQDGAAVVGRLKDFYSTQDSCEELATNIDLASLAQQVKDLTQHRWKSQAEARGANIQFQTFVLSNRLIRGYEPELRQALSNLVINAVDAIEGDGSITLSISDAGDKVRIQISDTGCGMPESIRSKCLDPFYTTKGNLGTGLGLSIVSGVVKRHGGEIDIESKSGLGSTVSISLPAVEAKQEEAPLATPSKSSESLRIMLVDDEAILLEVLSELLSSGGHRVENFECGEDAINAFKKGQFDLVITDRAMPNMSGDQLAAEIKAINPATPIIMATGFGDMISVTEEPLKNVDLVLAKPVPLEVLNQKLSELTSRELN